MKDVKPEDLEFVSSYIEDGELNVLVQIRSGDPSRARCWHLTADPTTRELREIRHTLSPNDRFEYPEFRTTPPIRARFREIVKDVKVKSCSPHASKASKA